MLLAGQKHQIAFTVSLYDVLQNWKGCSAVNVDLDPDYQILKPPLPMHVFYVSAHGGLPKPTLTSERVGISGNVIYCWKARDNLTSAVYKSVLNLAQFFKMAAKMADFMLKRAHSHNAAILKLFYKL